MHLFILLNKGVFISKELESRPNINE